MGDTHYRCKCLRIRDCLASLAPNAFLKTRQRIYANYANISPRNIKTDQKPWALCRTYGAPCVGGSLENLSGRAAVKGIHNCCAGCADAIQEAVDQVQGVEECEIGRKATSFKVKGSFSARSLVEAINAAGFHAQVVH